MLVLFYKFLMLKSLSHREKGTLIKKIQKVKQWRIYSPKNWKINVLQILFQSSSNQFFLLTYFIFVIPSPNLKPNVFLSKVLIPTSVWWNFALSTDENGWNFMHQWWEISVLYECFDPPLFLAHKCEVLSLHHWLRVFTSASAAKMRTVPGRRWSGETCLMYAFFWQ